MITFQTVDTPDGPFTVVEDRGTLAAAGWSSDPTAVAARAKVATPEPGECASANAVEAFYSGEAAALADYPVKLAGTEFQREVWEQLRRIPAGEVRTYGEVAQALGRPLASRAVGAACGANAIALFIPCHRVAGANGALTGFAWGVDVKRALLQRERVA